MTFRWRK